MFEIWFVPNPRNPEIVFRATENRFHNLESAKHVARSLTTKPEFKNASMLIYDIAKGRFIDA